MRVMGLDYGERRIGVAVSDGSGLLAFPRDVLTRTSLDRDLDTILATARREGVDRIVVGLPRSLDGTLQQQARVTLAFCEALAERASVPVETWDERFSSLEAEELLRARGIRPSREKGRIDSAAAAIVLQRWLDRHRGKHEAGS